MDESSIQRTGQDLSNRYKAAADNYGGQANTYQQQYGQYQGQAAEAQKALKDYTANMQNPQDVYKKALSDAQANIGFNPQSLATSTGNLTRLQDQLYAVNRASQSGAGAHGLSASDLAARYASMSSPLNEGVNAANNSVANLRGLYQDTMGQAGQESDKFYQGQQLQSSNLIATAAQAQKQLEDSASDYKNAQGLQQQYEAMYQAQGGLTAQQALAYGQAKAAAAAAAASYAQARLNTSQAVGNEWTNQQNANLPSALDNVLKVRSTPYSGTLGVASQDWTSPISVNAAPYNKPLAVNGAPYTGGLQVR